MIELYAITDYPGPPLPAADELGQAAATDSALAIAGAGRLAVVWSPTSEAPAAVTIDALRRHEAIVETLMTDRDLLPVRFGTRLADVGAAARLLIERRNELSRALARVRGTAEIAVRVAAAPGVRSDPTRALAAVHRPLALHARAATYRSGAGGDLLRGAYLVTREGVDPFVGAVADLQQSLPDLRLLCTGPWPPYSFSG